MTILSKGDEMKSLAIRNGISMQGKILYGG
jgi:hypothetical protein